MENEKIFFREKIFLIFPGKSRRTHGCIEEDERNLMRYNMTKKKAGEIFLGNFGDQKKSGKAEKGT